jgi:hypothetical protein
MPKIKSQNNRVRKLRTPNADLLAKYEKIMLYSAVYSQSEIVEKLQCSYGTISSAREYFETKKVSEFANEWNLKVNDRFNLVIRISGFVNRHPNFEIENLEDFNQFLAKLITKQPNAPIDFQLAFYEYEFKDLSILSNEESTDIFNALIGNKGFNRQIRSRYNDKIMLKEQYILELNVKEIFKSKDKRNKHEKPTVIATNDNLIML